jgi:ABC-type polysaccharide/polyol phosphate export permease
VFFRDLGNVSRHILRLWFYLSPGLYSLALLEEISIFKENPTLLTIMQANPFAILFEAYRAVIYGTPEHPPTLPDGPSVGLLFVVSVALLAVATILFKRLEPNFAKVL